jgi:hypothetical protein
MSLETLEDEAEYEYWYQIIADDIKQKIIDQFGDDNTRKVELSQIYDAL